jgi:efflux transporter, RND family, MFP subunit
MKKEISMKKGILFLSLLLVFLLSCGKKTEVKEYEVVKVERGDISLSTEKTGQVVSDNEISVYTTSSQRVQKVFFKKGDNVKKGDVVVTFYPVDKNETLRKIQIKSLEVEQKRRDLRNASELFKVGGASKVSVDDARIALETSKLELSTLQEDLSLIKDQIVSPVDGVITEMTADENYKVNTETTLFKVSDTKNMKVEVSLSDSQIKNVAVGQRVEITSDSLPNGEKVEGEVTEISGVATKSSSLDESNTAVTIKFNDAKNLRPGATINAVIFYKESRNVIKVPYSAVMNENGKFYVFTVDNSSKVTKKEVQIGTNDDSYYEVTSGLSEGDRIISVIDEALKDGEKIKIMDSSKSNGNNANVKSNKKKGKGGGPGGPPM